MEDTVTLTTLPAWTGMTTFASCMKRAMMVARSTTMMSMMALVVMEEVGEGRNDSRNEGGKGREEAFEASRWMMR